MTEMKGFVAYRCTFQCLKAHSHKFLFCFVFFRYYWKGEIQDASEILMVSPLAMLGSGVKEDIFDEILLLQLVKTKTSKIQQVVDYVR